MGIIPACLIACLSFECGLVGGDALAVNGTHRHTVNGVHRVNDGFHEELFSFARTRARRAHSILAQCQRYHAGAFWRQTDVSVTSKLRSDFIRRQKAQYLLISTERLRKRVRAACAYGPPRLHGVVADARVHMLSVGASFAQRHQQRLGGGENAEGLHVGSRGSLIHL